jgi:predicted P-loop ATPase
MPPEGFIEEEVQESEIEGDPAWQATLLDGRQGPLACEANVAIALRYAPELTGRLRFNELSQAAECTALPWRQYQGWRPWTDNDDTALAVWCQHQGIRAKPATCAGAVQLVAADRPHHPVRAYLDGLRWDGTPRIGTWLETYLDAKAKGEGEESEARGKLYLGQVGRKALIQAVARIYEPGCKADHTVILEGPQGALKSSAVRVLAKHEAWFTDEISDLGTKDAAQDLRGKWIIELAELSAMKRSEIERTKAFISRSTDHYRPSYGRRSQDFPRQCAFFGTTNADAYLGDETGGRRFWPVKVGTIKLDELRRDRDQLWAEAVEGYKAGEKWWLDAKAEIEARKEQKDRRHEDVWEEPVLDWAARQCLPFTAAEVLLHALHVQVENQDRGKEMRVSAILKGNGWVRKRAGTGNRSFGYVREPGVVTSEKTRTATPQAAKVMTEGVGCAEVVTEKALTLQCLSQPSQPSQPFLNSSKLDGVQELGENGKALQSLGKRLSGRDGCDVEPPDLARHLLNGNGHRDPNACVHCGRHCSPADTANSIRRSDGRWVHLGCELAQP